MTRPRLALRPRARVLRCRSSSGRAPPPPPALVAARIEAHSSAGDVVADLFGRGGWVARAALDRQRRAISLESSPLTRMLAEVVLRPPDVRHLDAAFQGMAASPRRESSLKVSLGDLFATRCATCGRTLVVDEISWAVDPTAEPGSAAAEPRPVARHYRCTVCRDQRGGGEQRQAPLDEEDLVRLHADVGVDEVRAALRGRFPAVDGAEDLVDELLALHTPRQLVGLAAIIDRIESDLRAAPVLAALRLAFLHAILPASRLTLAPGRTGAAADRRRARQAAGGGRSGASATRGSPSRTRSASCAASSSGSRAAPSARSRPASARTCGAWGRGPRPPSSALSSPSGPAAPRRTIPTPSSRGLPAPRLRLVLGQPPVRPELERLSRRVPRDGLGPRARGRRRCCRSTRCAGPSLRAAVELAGGDHRPVARGRRPRSMARDGRAVLLVDGGPEALAAAVLGGAGAGYRLVSARLADGDDDIGGSVELLPPGAARPPGAADPGQRVAPAGPGWRRRPGPRPRPGPVRRAGAVRPAAVLAPRRRPRTVTEVAVETLRARGEPARYERLLGEILVGLDRAGQLRRLATLEPAPESDLGAAASATAAPTRRPRDPTGRPIRPIRAARPPAARWTGGPAGPDGRGERAAGAPPSEPVVTPRIAAGRKPAPDPVDRLLALIRDEMSRPTNGRLRGDRARPLVARRPGGPRGRRASRSPTASNGPCSACSRRPARSRRPRSSTGSPRCSPATTCPTRPSSGPASTATAAMASTPDRLVTTDDLLRRSQEHTELLADARRRRPPAGDARLARAARAERRIDGELLGDRLDERERGAYLGGISRASEELARRRLHLVHPRQGRVPVRGRVDGHARRAAAAPPRPDPARRAARPLPRHRAGADRARPLQARPLAAAADRARDGRLAHPQVRTTCAGSSPRNAPDLADLEPLLGLDPMIERPRRADAAVRRLTRPVSRRRQADRRATGYPVVPSGRQPRLTRAHTRRTTPPWHRPILSPRPSTTWPTASGRRSSSSSRRSRRSTATTRYADRLEDPGPEGRAALRALMERTAAEAAAIPVDGLSTEERITRDMLHGHRRAPASRRTTSASTSCASSTRWAVRSSSCRS